MSIVRAGGFAAIFIAIFLAGCAAESTSSEDPADGGKPIAVKTVRAFSLGGQVTEVSRAGINGDVSDEVFAGQIAVLGLIPDTAEPNFPILMLPGFALGATIYLETPDGREGWAMNAVRRGHPVYIIEPAHSARAGFNPDPYTASQLGEGTESPLLFTWGRRGAWTRFGLGPAFGEAAAGSRFPVAHYDSIVRAFTPVDVGRIDGQAMIAHQLEANVAGIAALLERIGPSVLLTHSASGVPGFEVWRRQPDSVLAVVSVEPVGCLTEGIDSLSENPVLSVFGDHMELRPQMPARRDQCQAMVDYLSANGTPAAMFDLPQMGIKGNSHLLMGEKNSAELMARILDWLHDNVAL